MTVVDPQHRTESPDEEPQVPDPSSSLQFNTRPLNTLSPEDRVLFESFGQGAVAPLPHHLIHRAFEARVAEQPEATAIDHLGETITYRDLNTKANRLARRLSSLGVKGGDNVALFLRRSIPLVIGQLAVMKLGAAYVPQHVGVAPESQLRYVLNATRATVILTLEEFVDQIPADGQTVFALDRFLAKESDAGYVAAGDPFIADVAYTAANADSRAGQSPDDTSFILFTSGTTGNPNGVQVTHRNVCNILLTSPGNLGMGPGVKVAQILSIAFDMAAWETLGALMNGATLLIRGSNIEATVAQADVVIATPSILGSLDPDVCQNVKVAAVAGEPCPVPLAETWSSFCTFYNSCGPTETTIINTAKHFEAGAGGLTIGGPTPNNTVYVLDEHRKPCPIGEVGEMWAGGDCVTAGYLDNPALTEERYAPDPFLGEGRTMFRTRDLGRWTADGELEHFGRTDDQVKVRGFRVELDSVSAALETVPGCTAAVTLKHDSRNLVAWVQPADVDVNQARQAVADALPYYCVPAVITAIDELPRTARGKVDKRQLGDSVKLVDVADVPLSSNRTVAL